MASTFAAQCTRVGGIVDAVGVGVVTSRGGRGGGKKKSSSAEVSFWSRVFRSGSLERGECFEDGELARVRCGADDGDATRDWKLSVFSPSSSSSAAASLSSPLLSSSTSSSSASNMCLRRDILCLGAALVGGTAMLSSAVPSASAEEEILEVVEPPMAEAPAPVLAPQEAETETAPPKSGVKVDTTITEKVFMDLTICPNASRPDRTLGNTSQLCTVGEPLGRIVIGLYGRLVPQTVKNFKAMITGEAGTSYAGTIFHRVLPGQYIQAGRQGSKEKGEVSGELKLERNPEIVSPTSYKLTHTRPGTVSLALSENDDEDDLKLDIDYHNVQFLITTGPGPCPQLDNGNVVFGAVLEGLDVVAAVANVPTYRPSEKIKQFNDFAEFLGDERAANARNFWDRPLKTVVISRCGEIPLGMPVFPPGLP